MSEWKRIGKFLYWIAALAIFVGLLVLITACSDDDTILSPIVDAADFKPVPEKCNLDPCLPGCEAGPHIFECDPPVCLCHDSLICVCEDEKPPCLYEGTLLESTLC